MRFVLLLAAFSAGLYAQADLAQLYSAGQYADVIAATDRNPRDADTLFLRGMSLARLDRWGQAEQALRLGQSLAPQDPRFPTELAGVSYRLENYRQSRKLLRRALQLAPDDEYARNFLGSLYLLDSNLDAALAQWNRIGQPHLSSVEMPPRLRTDAVLLDRALTFAPSTTLKLSELRTSRARLNLLDAFAGSNFDLVPEPPGDGYKLRMRGTERSGLFGAPWRALIRSSRGLPYRTVFVEHDNGGGNASSLHAIARWDPYRRRANVVYSRPLASEARYRWRVFGDAREERWDLTRRIADLP
ncbi:MAG: tetratricopeptide repeat protein, partial [Acidobacteria bacterium]|nr:tetratricopeptide repeat protein [Acidobacteriota bacterium]